MCYGYHRELMMDRNSYDDGLNVETTNYRA